MSKQFLKGVTFAIIVLCCWNVSAQNQFSTKEPIYIFNNASCVQLYEYEETFLGETSQFYHYHFQVTDTSYLILELRLNTPKYVSSINGDILSCDQGTLDKNLLYRYQIGEQLVYFVDYANPGYKVFMVSDIFYRVERPTYFSYSHSQFSILCDYDEYYDPTQNISRNYEQIQYYYELDEAMGCTDIYTFQKHPPHVGNEMSTSQFVVGIGWYKEFTATKEILLKSINGIPFDQYLASACEGKYNLRPSDNPIPETRAQLKPATKIESAPVMRGGHEPVVQEQEETFAMPKIEYVDIPRDEDGIYIIPAKNLNGEVCESSYDVLDNLSKNIQPQKRDRYIVKSGDTLFSLARRYKTTVTAIKIENNLQSNVIHLNQEILIP